MTLLGFDVVGLFPAMKSENTGKIVRKRFLRSSMKIRGFSWKQGARYLAMNRTMTGELENLEKLLPKTKSGAKLKLKIKEINSKKEKIEDQWDFPEDVPTEEEEREIVARVAEIGVRAIFEHFCYRFGGKTFQQQSGGPIGARVTMAAARIVMQDWG